MFWEVPRKSQDTEGNYGNQQYGQKVKSYN